MMRIYYWRRTVLACVLVASAVLVQKQNLANICLPSPTFKVRAFCGWVVDDQFQPIIGAKVVLRRLVGGAEQVVVTMETDGKGQFEAKDIKPGQYMAEVSAPGYSVYQKEVVLVSCFKSKAKKLVYHLTIVDCPGVVLMTDQQLKECQQQSGA
jgi:hypothetical protein